MLRRRVLVGVILALLLVVVATGLTWWRLYRPTPMPAGPANVAVQNPNAQARVDHVVLIVEENHSYADVVGNKNAPYLNALIRQGALATNYHAVDHPSQPNYIEMTSGQPSSIRTDCEPSTACSSSARNIADDLEQAHRSWRAYEEDMPTACARSSTKLYKAKHNPFVYYDDISSNPDRCRQHDVPYSQLATDFRSLDTTPAFAFITPNICNDMHNCSLSTGDSWLSQEVPKLLATPAFIKQKSLLIITWDEDDFHHHNNHVVTLFLGPAARAGARSDRAYNHYDLYRTIDRLLGANPANSPNGPLMTDLVR